MADIKQEQASSAAITCTIASLAADARRESTAIDNSTNDFLDALVYVAVKLATGTPGDQKAIVIYAYGSEDGTNYTANATGSDAGITFRDPSGFVEIGRIPAPDAGALTYKSNPMSVAAAFGGILPRKWGIIIDNQTNVAFDSTEGNHTKSYTGIYATSE